MNQFSFKSALWKVGHYVAFILPLVVTLVPNNVENMTIGAVLAVVVNYFSTKFSV